MNPLIMQMKIEREKLKKQITELKIKIARLVNELSVYVGTYYGNLEEIDAEKIEQIGDELLKVKTEVIDLNIKLNNINKELGND